jgi:hypothetical protein
MPTRAQAAENWDLYIYNPVATVAAVKGMNVIIEQIEKETNGKRIGTGRSVVRALHPPRRFPFPPGYQTIAKADGDD